MNCWIDDLGDERPAVQSGRAGGAFELVPNKRRAEAFLRFGMVRVSSAPIWTIEFAPEAAWSAAVIRAGSMARELPAHSPVMIRWWHQGAWATERCTAAAATARIQAIAATDPVGEFARHEVMPLGVVEASAGVLGQAFRAWDSKQSWMSKFADRSLIFTHDRRGKLRVDHCGRMSGTAQIFGTEISRNARGRRADRLVADHRYEDVVSRDYETVMARGAPVLHKIRALCRPAGREPLWVAYHRLLLPVLTDGPPALILVSRFLPEANPVVR